MVKVNFLDRPIDVFTCMTDPAQPCVALIRGFPMVFRASSPIRVKVKAENWRRDSIANDKLLTKAQKQLMLGEIA